MIPLKAQADLLQLLIIMAYGAGFSIFAGIGLFIGLKVGRNRGYREAPEMYKKEWRQEHTDRLIAEARADTAEETTRYYKTVIDQLSVAGKPRNLELVERRTAR